MGMAQSRIPSSNQVQRIPRRFLPPLGFRPYLIRGVPIFLIDPHVSGNFHPHFWCLPGPATQRAAHAACHSAAARGGSAFQVGSATNGVKLAMMALAALVIKLRGPAPCRQPLALFSVLNWWKVTVSVVWNLLHWFHQSQAV